MLNYLSYIKKKILYSRFGRTFVPDRPLPIKYFQKIMHILNYKEYKLRKNYAKSYNKINEDNLINEKYGYKIINLNNVITDSDINLSISNLRKNYDSINWDNDELVNRKKSFLLMKKIEMNKDLKNLISSLLPIISNYIGTLPVLANASYWYSPNKKTEEGRSQSWHLDSEDFKQVKVFIPIEEITIENGPLTIIQADKSEKIRSLLQKKKIIKKRNTKLTDNIIEENYNDVNFIYPVTLKSDQIALVDTCRCYHYGSRKASNPRKLINLHFTSAFSLFTPMFRRKMLIDNTKVDQDRLVYGFENNNFYTFSDVVTKKWEIKIL